jgi:hypothetical protein
MNAKGRIEPRTLKGFRDYLPAAAIARERLIDTAKGVYRDFGFAPIDTPALEYTEILLGKGGDETDKQLYRFTDNGGRDVALRVRTAPACAPRRSGRGPHCCANPRPPRGRCRSGHRRNRSWPPLSPHRHAARWK